MKHLLLFILFSGSLDSFSQDRDTIKLALSGPAATFNNGESYSIWHLHDFGRPCKCSKCMDKTKPDTLRAICLVTLFPNGIAHARMGFVVIA